MPQVALVTPLAIEIMLHYHSRADDFPRLEASAVQETIAEFVAAGMLAEGPNTFLNQRTKFHITEGGQMYVAALMAVPLPVQRWVMPA